MLKSLKPKYQFIFQPPVYLLLRCWRLFQNHNFLRGLSRWKPGLLEASLLLREEESNNPSSPDTFTISLTGGLKSIRTFFRNIDYLSYFGKPITIIKFTYIGKHSCVLKTLEFSRSRLVLHPRCAAIALTSLNSY